MTLSQQPFDESGEVVRQLSRFLLQRHAQDIEAALLHPDADEHHPVTVSVVDLADHDAALAGSLLAYPKLVLRLLDAALRAAHDELAHGHPQQASMTPKDKLHARLAPLPFHLDMGAFETAPGIGELRSAHVGRLVTLHGTVVRAGALKMFEAKRLYECPKCRHRFLVHGDLEGGGAIQMPPGCPAPRGPDKQCRGVNFRQVPEYAYHTEYQEVRLQERSQCLGLGALPRSVAVVLTDEMADACAAGDDVEITGVVARQWRPLFPGAKADVDLVVYACGLSVAPAHDKGGVAEVGPEHVAGFEAFWDAHRDAPLKGRNKILASLCPQICGLFPVKLATALMLAGGVARVDGNGGHIRGDVHMLIVGDPGTGKSQFMKFAARVSPRSVMTTGKGSTGAGLTVTAMKEGGQWVLEAGALVLADGGLCCIDEFDGIREADRATIHEAMEQQTISVAKAGMVTTLPTRATVFGVTNPKGTYDPRQSVAVNTSLSGPLLSRFDIVLVLQDAKHPEWDEVVSRHILALHQRGGAPPSGHDKCWPIDTLRRYVAWVKAAFHPVLSPGAERVLLGYYQMQRRAADRQAARTTIRMLESLVRLAQAHARLMARGEVTVQDAVVAVAVAEHSTTGSPVLSASGYAASGGGGNGSGGVGAGAQAGFSDDPDADYARMEADVLAALGERQHGGGGGSSSSFYSGGDGGGGGDPSFGGLLPGPTSPTPATSAATAGAAAAPAPGCSGRGATATGAAGAAGAAAEGRGWGGGGMELGGAGGGQPHGGTTQIASIGGWGGGDGDGNYGGWNDDNGW